METFAYLESAVAYEDPNPEPQLRNLKELGLTIPSSAWMGLAAILLSASMLVAQVPQVQAYPATVTASSGVNIRSGPGTSYAVIGGLGNGARIEVVNSSNGWLQLSNGGWVAGDYTGRVGGGPGPAPGGTPVSGTVTVVSASGVNVRSGPGTNYAIIGGLPSGARTNVVSLSNGFYHLSSGGWIAANYTSGFGGGPGPAPGGTPVSGTVTVVSASGVNIRSGPSTAYAIIGGLPSGARANVVSLSNGFYRLSSGGWIAANLTSGINGGGGPGPGTGTPVSGTVTVISASGVNIRSGPGTSYAIIGGLGYGTQANVVSLSNGFYRLSSGGWIASNLTSGGGTTSPGGGAGTGYVTVRSLYGVNVRSGPSTSYAVIGGLANGARVRVVSLSNGFYQLSSGGWISSGYASP